jgi:integrase
VPAPGRVVAGLNPLSSTRTWRVRWCSRGESSTSGLNHHRSSRWVRRERGLAGSLPRRRKSPAVDQAVTSREPRSRVLSEEELKAFLRNLDDACRCHRLPHVLRLLLLTLQRRGELCSAEGREFDFEAGTRTADIERAAEGVHTLRVPKTDTRSDGVGTEPY